MKKVSPKARSLESDSPLTIAAMACSRMPKWKLRPPGLPGSKSPAPVNLSVVLFDEPRSADPPRNQGMFWARTFRTSPEASRPAIPLGSGLKLGRLRSRQDDRMRQCHAALLSATASCHHARTRTMFLSEVEVNVQNNVFQHSHLRPHWCIDASRLLPGRPCKFGGNSSEEFVGGRCSDRSGGLNQQPAPPILYIGEVRRRYYVVMIACFVRRQHTSALSWIADRAGRIASLLLPQVGDVHDLFRACETAEGLAGGAGSAVRVDAPRHGPVAAVCRNRSEAVVLRPTAP